MRAVMMTGLLLALLVQPARADGERTLLDMTIEVRPDGNAGQCMRLDPGTLTATVQTVVNGEAVPIRFVIGSAINGLQRTESAPVVTMVSAAPSTYTLPLQGGLYCYFLAYEGYRPPGPLTINDARVYAQYVALTLTWTP